MPFFGFLAILVLAGCRPASKKTEFTIGFSQCTFGDNWRKTMQKEMARELSFHPEIKFIVKDANLSSEKQIEQIQELIDDKIDLLIVCPNEAEPITPIADKAYERGIPVIVVDRSTLSKNYTAFIGANNYKVGLDAGAYANQLLKGKGNVMEIGGLQRGSSADIGRHDGFTDFIKKYPGLKYVSRFTADWDNYPQEWDKKFTELLASQTDIQFIFSQNDRVAFAAAKVCKKLGLDKKIAILGVDGLIGENGGIDLVEKGTLKATILYPTGGQEAILTAVNILKGKPYKKENDLASTIIDSGNVRIMRLQIEKLSAQQNDIYKRQQQIDEQIVISRNQTNTIYTISFLLALALILGGITYFYLNENRKINHKLELQNEEILSQQRQLIEMSVLAKEATEAKFNFFTNISHEFRTPLTLIMAPLEELLTSRMPATNHLHLRMIQRNVFRLLKMVNQLIDYRKVELHKMELRASSNDLVQFTREVVEAFSETARKRGIDLRFFTAENSLPVWFDVNMLDKVLFNMMSNAIKFTRDDGSIELFIEKSADGRFALVSVKDNGVGMKAEEVAHAFDLFYQGGYETYKGSGIGLSLSKELVELHKGKITLESEPKKGTTIRVELPLGTNHLQPNEMVLTDETNEQLRKENAVVYTADLMPVSNGYDDDADKEPSHEYTILVAEDNSDLLGFLSMRLGKSYDIILAENGQDAITKAFEELPDLVISDVMMPGKSGFELTKILKTDVRTSHIPVILLTAKTAVNQQIEGFNRLADAYIVKPFNVEVLENNIKSILDNHRRMKEHFTASNNLDPKLQSLKKNDRRFVNDFCTLVEANLSNESLRVEDICSQMGLSRVQLYRKVKTLLDCNVNEYILNTRLQKAKYFLQHENMPVSEVSYKVGFASPSYFSTVFKIKYEVTPKSFRDNK